MTTNAEKNRKTLKAKLTEAEFDQFNKARGRISSVDAVTLLLKWFIDQPDMIQKAVLGLLPKEIETDAAKLVLEQMAGEEVSKIKKRRAKKKSGGH